MSSPTIVYHRQEGQKFVTVTDVGGDFYVQVYLEYGDGRTVLERSEVCSHDMAITRAEVMATEEMLEAL